MLGWAESEDGGPTEREREKKNGDGSGSQAWDRRIVKTNECRRSSCWSYTVPSFRSYTVLVFRTHLFRFLGFLLVSPSPPSSLIVLCLNGRIYNCSPVLVGLPLSPPSCAADAGPGDPLEREPLPRSRWRLKALEGSSERALFRGDAS